MSNLARMGHQIYPVHGFCTIHFGRGQAIVRDKHGVLWEGVIHALTAMPQGNSRRGENIHRAKKKEGLQQ